MWWEGPYAGAYIEYSYIYLRRCSLPKGEGAQTCNNYVSGQNRENYIIFNKSRTFLFAFISYQRASTVTGAGRWKFIS